MVLDGVLGVRTRRLSLGLFTCMLIAVTLMLSNAAKFQFIDSKELGFGEVSVKPNNTDGHGHDFQVVNMDPSQRDSPSQAAPGNSTRGNSSLPHISGLRLVVDTIDPSLLKRPSKAVALDDPRAAYYPPGISTRGNSSLPHISGLRIAFVGDSLTRYMYLSLAAYLRRGRWVDETDVPNILEGKQFDAWNPFYNYTNNYFQPYEQCDCFRLEESDSAIENRYFADPVRDNVLYFFQKFGKMNTSGHWSHHEVHSKHNMSDVYIQPEWSYNWTSLITEHISKLTPKPKYLVFNAGVWSHDLGEAAVRDSIQQALNATNIVGIYKTTTFPRLKIPNPATYKEGRHDADVCKSMQNRCIDMSWTNNLTGHVHYVDKRHFRSHVNTAMNMQLLNLLNELE